VLGQRGLRGLDVDYYAEADLHALGLPERAVARLLRETHLSGHGGEPLVEAAALRDLIAGHPDGEDE
jgi:hypothetical protein